MMMSMRHEFVDHIPEQLDDGVLYVSIQFGTIIHRCACGCGQEVVTPLGPAEWRLTYDGRTVSLAPSIGNWNFQCRSHYWIENGNVRWARGFSPNEVDLVRQKARTRRDDYFVGRKVDDKEDVPEEGLQRGTIEDKQSRSKQTVWGRLRSLIRAIGQDGE